MKLRVLNSSANILTKEMNFVNHIAEMSMKVATSIELLYKLTRSLSEIIFNVIHFAYSSISFFFFLRVNFINDNEILKAHW